MTLCRTLVTGSVLALVWSTAPAAARSIELPYESAGLSEREAAAFLLDRLTYGTRPGQVDAVLETGLEPWTAAQLAGDAPEPDLARHLEQLEALGLAHAELAARYPSSSEVRAHMRRFHEGLIPHRDVPVMDFSVISAKTDEFRERLGLKTQDGELHEQLLAQKVLRTVYANNQLREVMTDFWLNHFFTSPASFNARLWVLPYEQEALRPNALGDFRGLLGAVAKHPGMLAYYSGNEQPAEIPPKQTTMAHALRQMRAGGKSATSVDALAATAQSEIVAMEYEKDLVLERQFWDETGPNLEYARSLVNLQTLGADGPQHEPDIRAVARAFTGWTTMPFGPSSEWFERGFDAATELGFEHEGSFLFRADQHDARPKQILGREFRAGGGVDEGERVLDFLAAHESTAWHIARKLAVRFVSESPSDALVGKLGAAFVEHEGDIAAVIETLVETPEFWQAANERSKVKTPLEYTASALRATGAEIESTQAVAERIARMGQPLYTYLEPTGFPDASSYWLDSASMIHRVNFAKDLAANALTGVTVDMDLVPASESARGLVDDLASVMLPGRKLDETLENIASAASGWPADGPPMPRLAALVIASPEFQLR